MSPRAEACYAKFADNLSLAERLEQTLPDQKQWSCVVLFYATLHLLNAYLIDKKQISLAPSSTEHAERKKAMNRCPELRDAPKKYRQLKDLSESVRYDAGFKYTDAHHQQARTIVNRIIAIVESKLGKAKM